MSVATVVSAHISGLSVEQVTVEADVSHGLYSFSIVGLPDKAIDESKDRIIAALKNTGLHNPKTDGQKVTVSLLPADTKKEGSHLDIPVALAYLAASKQIRTPDTSSWFFGELSLSGESMPMRGALLVARKAKQEHIKRIYVPYKNREEAALVHGIEVYGYATLEDLVVHLGGLPEKKDVRELVPEEETLIRHIPAPSTVDFATIKGQEKAKRALLLAASGGHNIALYGPPGTGKTMLAKAFTGILPPLTDEEILEVTEIHSLAGKEAIIHTNPPLRSPHHTSSHVSLVGGGTHPRPGEITLAHRGVLFLDEFPEFDTRVLESLREPLEEGRITVSRAKGSSTFPASCTLIASMNPCPCGYYGSNSKTCVCKPSDIAKYARKVSGPIMDRIDIWVPVQHVPYDILAEKVEETSSETLRKIVVASRNFATKRYKTLNLTHVTKNKDLRPEDIDTHITLHDSTKALMKKLSSSHLLSPRAYHRVLRLARTIADVRNSEHVEEQDILEAFQYRPKLYEV